MSIFISYRRADSKYVVDRMRERLVTAFGPEAIFRDIESIGLGLDFRTVLSRETAGCRVMLVVIGPQWVNITDSKGNKRLFEEGDATRIEVETGLLGPEILVIPVLVMNAGMPSADELPESLCELHYRNAISVRPDPDFDNDIEKLIAGIQGSPNWLSKPLELKSFEPETIPVSKGSFWMGSPEEPEFPNHEKPRHEVTLPSYRIGRNPVTNAQYAEFIRQTGRLVSPAMGWEGQRPPNALEEGPVSGVTWYEALAYCQWLSQKTGRTYSLPNEAQWEKACRGSYGFSSPGNLLEWTCSLWGEKRTPPNPKYGYPWKDDGRNNLNANGQIRRVVRGGATQDGSGMVRCSARRGETPDNAGLPGAQHGFRVVMSVDSAQR